MKPKEYFKKNKTVVTDEERIRIDIMGIFLGARLKLGISQSEFAKQLKTKQPAIAQWENGTRLPTILSLCRLAKLQNKKLIISFK